jgi:tetratricopeptide (TPR) repeat protein
MSSIPRRDGIFISYRREETAAYAGRLFDRLSDHFGEDRVFMDVDSIAIGVDFTEAVIEAVSGCVILLALIGRDWSTVADSRGKRRLDNPDDFVRIEIEAALQRDIRVVPVLVDGASLPQADDLPSSLRSLTRRQALEVSHTSFRSEVARLITAADEVFKAARGRSVSPPKTSGRDRRVEQRGQQELSGAETTPRQKGPQAARSAPDLRRERFAQDDPQRVTLFLREARKCSDDEKYDLAIGHFTDALGLDPNNQNIFIERGNACWYAGLLGQAISDFDQALQIGPDSASVLSSRGQALAEAGRFTEAVVDLQRVILQAGKPGMSFVVAYSHNGLGLAYGGLGMFDRALSEFDLSLRQSPGNAWVYFNRGVTYDRMGQYGKALTEFQQALKNEDPSLPPLKRQAAQQRLRRTQPR